MTRPRLVAFFYLISCVIVFYFPSTRVVLLLYR